MSKGKIITFSIIGFIILLSTVLFGFVFRLRKQIVIVVGTDVEYSSNDIIATAGLKNGKSIFLLDKELAISNIENKYADLKVIQIKTISATQIEIFVRKRYEAYYTKYLGNYYVLDQDLKVLKVIPENEDSEIAQAENLVHITTKLDNLNDVTKQSNFVGSSNQQNMTYNLFSAIYSTQMPDKETGAEAYLKFCELVDAVSFDVGYTSDGKLYDRLIVKTKQGLIFDVGQATNNLERKINICFATMNSEQIADKTQGVIKIFYKTLTEERITYTLGETE